MVVVRSSRSRTVVVTTALGAVCDFVSTATPPRYDHSNACDEKSDEFIFMAVVEWKSNFSRMALEP